MKQIMQPLIVVLGATGSGKSKLAIEIASKFRGEIINADVMQMYRGFDIITNKISNAEQSLCPHHLMDFVDPFTDKFNITEFKQLALEKIKEIDERNNLPIVVGGTNYYIESLLWDFTLPPETIKHPPSEIKNLYLNEMTSDLHNKLLSIDPISAKQIHPKDRRKIIRALEIFDATGLTKSEQLSNQHEGQTIGNLVGGSLVFKNSCMIWVQCQQEVLDERLNHRVENMVENGLDKELKDFYLKFMSTNTLNENNFQSGILQSIGFKEFLPYLSDKDNSQKKFIEGIENMKTITRRYSRKQLKWINNRFLKRNELNTPPIYAVDSTHLNRWDNDVRDQAFNIVDQFLKNNVSSLRPLVHSNYDNASVYNYCSCCQLHFVKEMVWKAHLSSKKHKKMLARLKLIDGYSHTSSL